MELYWKRYLFVCLVAENKIVQIVGLQPCWAVVSLAEFFYFFHPNTVGSNDTLFAAKPVIFH